MTTQWDKSKLWAFNILLKERKDQQLKVRLDGVQAVCFKLGEHWIGVCLIPVSVFHSCFILS